MLTKEQTNQIIKQFDKERAEDSEAELDGVKYYLSEIESEGWKSYGKYEQNYFIYELVSEEGENPGVFIGLGVTRSGSYYSDYYYEYEEFEQVEQIEKTIVVKEWVIKND